MAVFHKFLSASSRPNWLAAAFGLLSWPGTVALAQFSTTQTLHVRVETVATGLDQSAQIFPTDLVPFQDGSGRHLVVTLGGLLHVLDPQQGLLARRYLDARDANSLTASNGLSSYGFTTAAFHPDFSTPGMDGFGKLFLVASEVTQTDPPPDFPSPAGVPNLGDPNPHHDRVLYEYTVGNIADNALLLGRTVTRREVLRIHEPRRGHDVNDLLFDQEGYLLISLGDTVHRNVTSQVLSNVFGKVLRIDPLDPEAASAINANDRVSDNEKYRVPGSNPLFDGSNADGDLDEIFAYGLRNPWRLDLDEATGDVLIAHVGEGQREAIVAIGPAGGDNFGWPYFEGTRQIHAPPGGFTYTPPLFEYSHNFIGGAGSITGGVMYDGNRIPALDGMVVFGDTLADLVLFGDPDTGEFYRMLPRPLSDPLPSGIVSINQGSDGAIYLLGFDGTIARIIPEPASAVLLGTASLCVLAITRRLRPSSPHPIRRSCKERCQKCS